jgi:hypothetical protein
MQHELAGQRCDECACSAVAAALGRVPRQTSWRHWRQYAYCKRFLGRWCMALFVVRHQHPAERCPAKDPQMGEMLLQQLSGPNAAKAGISINGEAVVNNEHTLYLILESDTENRVREFMQPFAMAGSVDIYPASTCSEVVGRRGCAAA